MLKQLCLQPTVERGSTSASLSSSERSPTGSLCETYLCGINAKTHHIRCARSVRDACDWTSWSVSVVRVAKIKCTSIKCDKWQTFSVITCARQNFQPAILRIEIYRSAGRIVWLCSVCTITRRYCSQSVTIRHDYSTKTNSANERRTQSAAD